MSGFNRAKILQYSDDMEIETEKETNKMKQNFVVAFKIFLVPIIIIAFIGIIVFLGWGVISLLLFLWNVSKILTIIAALVIMYLFILLFVIILNLGGD